MSFTVRLITDQGVVEYRDVYRISDNTESLIVSTVGQRNRHDAAAIRHIDIFWTKPA